MGAVNNTAVSAYSAEGANFPRAPIGSWAATPPTSTGGLPRSAAIESVSEEAAGARNLLGIQETLAAGVPRPIHHEADLTLSSPRVAEILDRAESLTLAAGGHVESRDGDNGFAILRVPVDSLFSVLDRLERLSPVLLRRVATVDLGEAIADTELRLQILDRTQARLQQLLARSRDDGERRRLLEEISNVVEELEHLRLRRRQLQDQAVFSTIRLKILAPEQGPGLLQHVPEALRWLRGLPTVPPIDTRPGRRVCWKVPLGFVEIRPRNDHRWMAASADGVEIRAFYRRNEPRGDSRFWRDASRPIVAPGHRDSGLFEIRTWSVMRLSTWGPTPAAFWIAFRADGGKNVEVFEAFFPDSALEARHGPALRTFLGGLP